ncbi:hypothetical protein [uncultured Christiangramia sp.]|uniref:hypothetical protein n=1 Tax=Christiangramia sp. 3-2217-3z TaxID=3417564 RepID=UPI00261468E3|nr:hypothetical protein [uncultured Christiangramia sp.]|tara:strand:- start:14 stop:532 length:519 start_codon:yes stop_codon:yes gene_type:complete
MKKYLFSLLSVISILSCSKNDDNTEPEIQQVDKVIFGGIYGLCGGDCRDLYMINEKVLLKDADSELDEYGEWSSTTFNEELDLENFNNSSNLLNVPSELLDGDLTQEDLVQSWADVDYYIYVEKDGRSEEIILDHIHKNASSAVKKYFKNFLETYKELGGYMIDTTNVERYY